MEVVACWEEIAEIARTLLREEQESPRPEAQSMGEGEAVQRDRHGGSREERSPRWSSESITAA